MNIDLGDFVIEGKDRAGKYDKFDLFKTTIIQSGKMEGQTLKRPQWYDCSLKDCLKTIVQVRAEKEGTFENVESYLDRYEKITKDFHKDLEKIEKVFLSLVEINTKLLK
ncbi:hypothetical protein Phi19:2_gp050 [Cellulophaga phage phi19:2]|uniref:Uncharacterized protein n=3 Tax=Cellulophaga phage phiST TaxID=756282 RepID=M4SLA1_9CAUD|nr:hypothetical protein CGPG_00059 [Cellulophaga phage phiST]AGH56758.1 hypothetical protein CGPG_00059 [Cellulophaga phage phiST]AGO47189.1 hypothetical protein PhiST_gp050 [Cellulophaga phage phiST]AGO48685.1 hypothetical protein Phi19:2_gp050 [Cellulophaga phage phi19:2]AGO49055.1 hypothetical protein Phi13:1_gp044 [Cellulophaga phage phi13:1]